MSPPYGFLGRRVVRSAEIQRGAPALHKPSPPRGRTDAGALTNFGISLAGIGKPQEATRVFRRVVEISPTDANAHRNLAKAFLNDDQD
jgi:Flp pilus assembly protein TadD